MEKKRAERAEQPSLTFLPVLLIIICDAESSAALLPAIMKDII
jgi:hypothetical protein